MAQPAQPNNAIPPIPQPVQTGYRIGVGTASDYFYDHGIFVKRFQGCTEIVHVAVSKTDVKTGISTWNETADGNGIRWKPISDNFADSRFPRYDSEWELVVFKNPSNAQRVARYINVKEEYSYNVTFMGWDAHPAVQPVSLTPVP